MKVHLIIAAITATTGTALAASESSSDACRKAYDKLYAKPEIKMNLFLGYLNEGDQTQDGMVKSEFVDGLTGPCTNGNSLCGFTRDKDDADIFFKNIVGPDGKPRKVRLRVVNSSYSSDTSKNTGPLQTSISNDVRNQFLDSIGSDDVVIYQGHAGLGVGPMFGPKEEDRLTVDSLARHVRNAKHKPTVLGMVVCKGEQNYGNKLHAAAPHSALVLTRQTTAIDDGLATVRATFNSLLGLKCEDQFKNAFRNATMFFNYGFFEPGGDTSFDRKTPRISNFFSPINEKFPDVPSGLRQFLEHKMERRVISPSSKPEGTAR